MAKKNPPGATAGALNHAFGTRPVGIAGAKSAGKPDAPLSLGLLTAVAMVAGAKNGAVDVRHAQAYRSKLIGARVAETTRLIRHLPAWPSLN
jgi:hypothetical protein